jgi:iron complex transport system substrate-binding protein
MKSMRVVSLLASATEIVCALGASDTLVGRSHECDNPSWVRSLPPCSEPAFDISVSSREIDAEVNRRIRSGEPLYRIHTDLIRALAPDLLIAQAHCEVCGVTQGDVERSGCEILAKRVLPLTASSLDGILGSIQQIAQAIGRESEGLAVVSRERRRMEQVRRKTAGRRAAPSVVMLEWADPLFAMGNWGPELVEIANGSLLLGSPGQHSRAIPADLVREADPEYLIIAPCGFNLQRALQERLVLEAYPWWSSLSAVRAGKVAFADGNLFFNRSGMTISQTAEILAEILHGVTLGEPAQGVHWYWIDQVGRYQSTSEAARTA